MNHYASACISCNKQIRDGIYNSLFYTNLLTVLSAFIAIAVIVIALIYLNGLQRRKKQLDGDYLSPTPVHTAGIVLGIGLGGFADGIILHQILQWHEMLSAKVPATNYVGKSVNMFWDGIFHSFCLMVVLIGIALLWRALILPDSLKSRQLLAGGTLTGWAVFNVIEGVINHQWLKLHNVMEYAVNHKTANLWFIGLSIILFVFGVWMSKRSTHH